MRASAHTVVSAPAENVWAVVCDPERVLSFMSGITRWEVESERPTGLGARYRTLMRVASASNATRRSCSSRSRRAASVK